MPESPTDLIEQWRRAKTGDGAARTLVAELAREVALAELRRRGAPPAALDDLVQEVVRSTLAFLARSPDEPRELRTFLKYRSWGVLSDHRKHMRTALPIADAAEAPEAVAADDGPELRVHRGQLATALADCMARLSTEQREALELRYSARLETETIAARLAVHRNTINVRVFRALDRLRDCLARKGFDAGDLDGPVERRSALRGSER